MNQKGFAVTSVLYGLAILGMMVIVILMGTLSSSRNNVNEEAKSTEDMLLSYGESQVTFTSNKPYTVPEDGWYRIEAFGSGTSSNRGNYVTGVIKLTKGNILNLEIPSSSDTIVSVKENSSSSTSTTIIQVGKSSSSLQGYPNSSSSSLNYPFVDCLKISKVHDGDGKVIIQKVGDQLKRKNELLNGVTKIINGDKVKICYSYNGGNKINCSSNSTIPVSPKQDIDDLVIYASSEVNVNNKNGNFTIYPKPLSSEPPYGITPDSYGIHFSAYQPDWTTGNITGCTNNFPDHGTYYLLPVNSKNMAISGYSNPEYSLKSLKLEYLNGEESQKWTIDVINIPDNCPDAKGTSVYPNISSSGLRKEYRIVNTASYNALQIYQDENYPENYTISSQSFNTMSRNEPQIWYVMPLNDGTFAIKTSVPSAWKNLNRSGFLYGDTSNQYVKIGVAKNNTVDDENFTFPTPDERFYLYSLY